MKRQKEYKNESKEKDYSTQKFSKLSKDLIKSEEEMYYLTQKCCALGTVLNNLPFWKMTSQDRLNHENFYQVEKLACEYLNHFSNYFEFKYRLSISDLYLPNLSHCERQEEDDETNPIQSPIQKCIIEFNPDKTQFFTDYFIYNMNEVAKRLVGKEKQQPEFFGDKESPEIYKIRNKLARMGMDKSTQQFWKYYQYNGGLDREMRERVFEYCSCDLIDYLLSLSKSESEKQINKAMIPLMNRVASYTSTAEDEEVCVFDTVFDRNNNLLNELDIKKILDILDQNYKVCNDSNAYKAKQVLRLELTISIASYFSGKQASIAFYDISRQSTNADIAIDDALPKSSILDYIKNLSFFEESVFDEYIIKSHTVIKKEIAEISKKNRSKKNLLTETDKSKILSKISKRNILNDKEIAHRIGINNSTSVCRIKNLFLAKIESQVKEYLDSQKYLDLDKSCNELKRSMQ